MLIIVGSFSITFQNITPNIDQSIASEEEELNLGDLNLIFTDSVDINISQNVKSSLAQSLNIDQDEIQLDYRNFDTSKMLTRGKGELPDNQWIRINLYSLQNDSEPLINQFQKVGRMPFKNASGEIALDQSYAEKDGVKIGDRVLLYGPFGEARFRIVGLIRAIEFASYEINQVTYGYVSEVGLIRHYAKPSLPGRVNMVLVHFDHAIPVDQLKLAVIQLREDLNEAGYGDVLAFIWLVRISSIRRGLQDALEFTSIYLVYASYFIFILAGIIVFTIFRRSLFNNQKAYGSLYAQGYEQTSLLNAYFMKATILVLTSTLPTILMSQGLTYIIVDNLTQSWGVRNAPTTLSFQSILISQGLLLTLSIFFTRLSLASLLKRTPVEIIENHGRDTLIEHRKIIAVINLVHNKMLKFALRDLTRNQTRSLLTIISLIIGFSFAGSLLHTNSAISHTVDEFYDQNVKFDLEVDLGFNGSIGLQLNLSEFPFQDTNFDSINDIEFFEYMLQVPVQLFDDPEVVTVFVGINHDTTMFNYQENSIIEGRWFTNNSNEVVISKYLSDNFGFGVDSILKIPIRWIVAEFVVVGVINELYTTSTIMGDLIYMSELAQEFLNQEKWVFFANKILIQIQADVNLGLIINFLNKERTDVTIAVSEDFYLRRVDRFTQSQAIITYFMMILGYVLALIISFSMLNLSYLEREKEYCLLNVLGFSKAEVSLQYLFENSILVLISSSVAILLSILLAELVWISVIESSFFLVARNYSLVNAAIIFFSSFVILILTTIPNIVRYYLTPVYTRLNDD